MKNIAVLGSTGSIGTQTLDVVRANPERLCVKALAAGHNITQLESQIREFHPQIAAVWDEEKAKELRICTADLPVKIVSGMEGLLEIAQMEEAEVLVTAIVGMIGIRPTIAAIKAGKDIALANKETLVTAGHIIMPLAKEYNVKILPVDSEHSAIFQSLNGEKKTQIDKILLTASGGPFRGKDKAFLKHVQLEDALKHPNWSMGHKITIDSASMVNKGLEVMEAKWLFDVELDQIQVVIQPQSIIHSMDDYFDKIYLSYELHELKPSEAIFRKVIADSGVIPSETLFIDDGRKNVDAAQALGFAVYMPAPGEDFGHLFEEITR